jgi:hypothetical protein
MRIKIDSVHEVHAYLNGEGYVGPVLSFVKDPRKEMFKKFLNNWRDFQDILFRKLPDIYYFSYQYFTDYIDLYIKIFRGTR